MFYLFFWKYCFSLLVDFRFTISYYNIILNLYLGKNSLLETCLSLRNAYLKENQIDTIVWEIHRVGLWSRILHFSSYELKLNKF